VAIPTFQSDRDAADYWAKHDSSAYAKDLPAVALKASPALRRQVAARAKRPVTLRLEEGQIAAAKRAADGMSLPYQALLRNVDRRAIGEGARGVNGGAGPRTPRDRVA
jgi:hypothetical protein